MKRVLPVRIPVYIETEIIAGRKSYAGIIGNMSLEGLFAETIPTHTVTPFIPGKTVHLKFYVSSEDTLSLRCKVIWLYTKKDESAGFVNSMGMKIITPSVQYKKYLKTL